jgi:hypothetical protein
MSDFSTLFAGLTQEQQLYLQQQNARLMMIRSMNQSSSGASLSLQSSHSSIITGSTSDPAHNMQSLNLPALGASPPKIAPTGYYLRRQNDAPSSQAPQMPSNATPVHDIPHEDVLQQPQYQSQSQLRHTQPHEIVQTSNDLQQQRLLQQQILQLQQQYQLQLQAQQQQQQIQEHRQQQIHLDTEKEKLRQIHDAEQRAAEQIPPNAQHQAQRVPPPTFSNLKAAAVNSALPHLESPNLLSLLEKPDPSLTYSTFIVLWRQTAHTRREIMSRPPLLQSHRPTTVPQQHVPPNRREDQSASIAPIPSHISSTLSLAKGAELLSPEPEDSHVHNAAYFKVLPSVFFFFFCLISTFA